MSTLLQPREEIHEACREGRYAKVEELLLANPKLATRRDSDERLPLHWAIVHNHPSIVQLLSEQASFDVDAADGSGWTPLHLACSIKDGEALAATLLHRGADANAQTAAGTTPLHFCVSKQNLPLVRLLLEKKASARTRDKRGQLPIHRAAAVGSSPLVALLLDSRSPVNVQDVDGCTPLHHAIAEGHGDAAVTLLKRGAESDIKNKAGRLAIEEAPDKNVGMYILNAAREEGIDVAMPEGFKA
ncbi:ankyrin repeat-containing domain protein [Sphaerosporella brunnea]|uniref:Ankyrin repeat-containing domain protein n=1 Tax=Sphaerosporella brunnea TaxID=1250544 RepID=A0A5J5EMU5_9PEZI|nr:ankyrin repeat-containing domain protein [Sphaerosporella brunnea]